MWNSKTAILYAIITYTHVHDIHISVPIPHMCTYLGSLVCDIKELPSNTTRVLVAEAVIIIKLKELSSSVTAMGNTCTCKSLEKKEIDKIKEINKIKDIGQRAIDIMNEVLKNITSLKEKVEKVQNDDEMQEINDMQRRLQWQKVSLQQEIQPLIQGFPLRAEEIQEQQEKILLLEEVQKVYIKINQHMQQILRDVEDMKQQLQELKNQMHVILEIGQYEQEKHSENELEVVLEQLKNQLLRTLRGLDTLPTIQVVEQAHDEKLYYHYTRMLNLPGFKQKTLKSKVTTTFQKIVHICQTHEHKGKKIQQEMQQLQEQAKKIETTPLMQQRLEQHGEVQKQMKWIQKKAKLIENQATTLWDEYYMKIACLAALRSKDPSTPVS